MIISHHLGAAAALGSSVTWAFASTRYAQASRDIGSQRVNLARAIVVVPIYATLLLVTRGAHALDGVDGPHAGWLLGSVMCSYALADGLFFAAARRLGISTALSIASSYPLWAALAGAVVRGEPFGPWRVGGTVLCVGGVVALVRLHASAAPIADGKRHSDPLGIALAIGTSVLWAGNSFSIKEASHGLGVWQVNAVRYTMALALLSAQVAFLRPAPRPRPARGWPSLVPAILADAFLGSVLYVIGLANTDLAVGSTLSSLAPLISVPFAIALGEEKWNAARFAAVTATVGGIAILVAS
jgi:drug/metabolite transporter (DMT)-like permease